MGKPKKKRVMVNRCSTNPAMLSYAFQLWAIGICGGSGPLGRQHLMVFPGDSENYCALYLSRNELRQLKRDIEKALGRQVER